MADTKEKKQTLTIEEYCESPLVSLTQREKFAYVFSFKSEVPKTIEQWQSFLKDK